jgi:amino acid transporter
MLGFTASGCIVFSSNILVAAGHTVSAWNERGIAIGVIIFVTIIHTFTPKLSVLFMNALGSIKVIILLFIVITGFVASVEVFRQSQTPTRVFPHARCILLAHMQLPYSRSSILTQAGVMLLTF